MPSKFEQQLKEHTLEEEKKFDDICNTLEKIKDNHLAHIEKNITDINLTHTEMKTDLAWLLKFFWLIMGSSIGALVTSVFNLISK